MGFSSRVSSGLQALKPLLKENGASTLMAYILRRETRQRVLMRIKVAGETILVRTGTNDLNVARSCLGKEFRSLSGIYPRDVRGLMVDAGGYIGTAALALSKMYPNATVVTIEPSTENFTILKENIAGHSNIFAENAALLPKSAAKSIELRNRGTGHWGFTIIEKPDDYSATCLENVDTISLEDIMKKHGFKDVLILKMDIEGGEYALMKDGGWLARTNVLFIELHENIVKGCNELFFKSNANRYIYKDAGEKYISVGKSYFS